MQTFVRMGMVGASVMGIVVATAACNPKGACVQTFDDGKTFTCNEELTKSVCGQGKGDKWVGGTCKDAGYTKKVKGSEGVWEK